MAIHVVQLNSLMHAADTQSDQTELSDSLAQGLYDLLDAEMLGYRGGQNRSSWDIDVEGHNWGETDGFLELVRSVQVRSNWQGRGIQRNR